MNFLTSALDGGQWSASHSGRFTAGERVPRYPLDGGWVRPTAGLEAVAKMKNRNQTQVLQPVAYSLY